MLDNTMLVYVHEHAEANPHKNNGLAMIVAGHASKKIAMGRHTKVTGTVGDLYLTISEEVMKADLGKFPTATRRMTEVLA